MKVTSLKDMESYIYSGVILPLKGLEIEPLSLSSPITDNNGAVYFEVFTEDRGEPTQHNYQREEARRNAKWLIAVADRVKSMVVADYETHRHEVHIYEPAFSQFNGGAFIKGKLIEAFGKYEPFGKVILVNALYADPLEAGGAVHDGAIPQPIFRPERIPF